MTRVERLTKQLLNFLVQAGYPSVRIDCQGLVLANGQFCGEVFAFLECDLNLTDQDRQDFVGVAANAWKRVLADNNVTAVRIA